MPKIVINEQDLTTTPLRVTNNNVVFIPGFYGSDVTGYNGSETISLVSAPPAAKNYTTEPATSSASASGTIQSGSTATFVLNLDYAPAESYANKITNNDYTDITLSVKEDTEVSNAELNNNGKQLVVSVRNSQGSTINITVTYEYSYGTKIIVTPNTSSQIISVDKSAVDVHSNVLDVKCESNKVYIYITDETNDISGSFTAKVLKDGAYLVCNNISEFEEKVGTTAQTADKDVAYTAINTALGSTYPKFTSLKYKENPDATTYTDADYTLPVNFIGKNAVDRSFVIAKELLNNGIPVLYYAVAGELNARSIAGMYKKLIGTMPSTYSGEIKDSVFYELRGLGDYAVKYLTTGGYPSFGLTLSVISENNAEIIYNPLVDQMIYCSSRRGDCTVLVDGYNNPDGDHKDFYKAVKSYIAIIEKEMPTDITTGDPNGNDYIYGNREHIGRSNGNQGYTSTAYSTATMIYPWIDVTMQLTTGEVQVPGSYAYLRALAQSIKQGSDWNAIAGVTRGQIPGFVRLCTNVPLTNTVADYMQPTNDVAINPITYIRPYGERIWGNRTLKNNSIAPEIGMEPGLTASSFLNIRNAVSDIKKQVYDSCNSLMFEPNTDVLWINFQSKIQPLLDRMKSSEIFSGYKIIHNTSKYPYKLLATIVVYPVYAVEEFEITVQLSNEELIIEG